MSSAPIAYLVWYTISSGAGDEPLPVTRDQLRKALFEAGIDTAYLPPPGRAIDAFRTATSGLTDTYERGDVTVTLSTREVEATTEVVTRNVYATWQDSDGAKRERRVAYLQFFRPRRTAAGRVPGSERLRALVDQRLTGIDKERAKAFVTRVQDLYTVNRERLNAHAVRAVVRGYLSNVGAVPVASSTGGWYVIPPQTRAAVHGLREVVRRCGDGCRMRIIPLPNDADMREMVLESVDQDITTRAQVVIRDMAELTEKDPTATPSTSRWSAWLADCRVLEDLLLSYGDRYNATFPTAASTLERAMEMVNTFGRRIAAAKGA